MEVFDHEQNQTTERRESHDPVSAGQMPERAEHDHLDVRRQLDTPTINKLCSVLECTSDYLLGRSEVRDPIISNEDALRIKAYHALPERDRRIVDTILADYIEKARTVNRKAPK